MVNDPPRTLYDVAVPRVAPRDHKLCYEVRVRRHGAGRADAWAVHKRWSEARDMARALSQIRGLPPLPPFPDSVKQALIASSAGGEKRRAALEAYLKRLFRALGDRRDRYYAPALVAFFGGRICPDGRDRPPKPKAPLRPRPPPEVAPEPPMKPPKPPAPRTYHVPSAGAMARRPSGRRRASFFSSGSQAPTGAVLQKPTPPACLRCAKMIYDRGLPKSVGSPQVRLADDVERPLHGWQGLADRAAIGVVVNSSFCEDAGRTVVVVAFATAPRFKADVSEVVARDEDAVENDLVGRILNAHNSFEGLAY